MIKNDHNHKKISNQIKCIEREIFKRINYYPNLVARGKMTQFMADYEITCMKEVLQTLVMADRLHLDKPFNQAKEI